MTGDFRIITIEEHAPIKNKDSIVSSFAFGSVIVINKDLNPIGIRGLLFDCESKINPIILSSLNLYRDNSLNIDKSKIGFFFSDSRVKPQIFAGIKCSGFFLSFTQLATVPELVGIDLLEDGYIANEYKGFKICEKWEPPRRHTQALSKETKIQRKLKKTTILPGQFYFHKKTSHFGDVLPLIKPHDIISISHKLHGTSFICSNVLCRKPLNPIFKLVTLGLYKPTHYKNIYSSRSVIKNDLNKEGKQHYYKKDIWGVVNDKIGFLIPKGISLYGEITGYVGDSYIQSQYDYGSNQGKFKYWIYRIIETTPQGNIKEFSTNDILDFCSTHGFWTVPYIYNGVASDWLEPKTPSYYGRDLFDHLTELFLEKNCDFCFNQVPAEGVVLRIETTPNLWSAFKLKSFAFRVKESKQEVQDIEIEN